MRDWTRFCYVIGFENIRIHRPYVIGFVVDKCFTLWSRIFLVTSCYRNRNKLRPDGLLCSYADFTFTREGRQNSCWISNDTSKDFIFERNDFSSVIAVSLMARTGLITIYLLVVDFPRGARCAKTQTPGGGCCAAYPTGEEHFTGRGKSKKGKACSGEKSQDHGTDVCLTESIHQGKCRVTGINGN